VDTTNLAISVRRARPDDAPALAQLVNRAYEVEGFFVEGNRTTPGEIALLVAKGTFLVLERSVETEDDDADPVLAAAVYVDHGPDGGYIGMLSVDPALQGQGLGTRLVRIAEAMCEAMEATSVRLRIVNLREELARWYRSLGYEEVGTFPYDRPVKQPCHFVEMTKQLVPATAPARGSAPRDVTVSALA
jgi:ribosomal protein S18 acetylase RimI-like enzyme